MKSVHNHLCTLHTAHRSGWKLVTKWRWTEHINLICGFNIWQVARASVWYNRKIKCFFSQVFGFFLFISGCEKHARFYIHKPDRIHTLTRTHYQSFCVQYSFSYYIKGWDDDKNKFAWNMYDDGPRNIRLHCRTKFTVILHSNEKQTWLYMYVYRSWCKRGCKHFIGITR